MVMMVALRHTRWLGIPAWMLAGALVLGLLAGVLMPRLAISAQDAESEIYTAFAGGADVYNSALLAFAPQVLRVHRGDTVTWLNNGFHNIHFQEGLTDLVIAPEVNGAPLPQVNPAVAFPTIEDGGVFQGGDANSGLPLDPVEGVSFTLVMDVEPGTYAYFCDVHPGMVGTIEVVDAAVAIPSPEDALIAGATELTLSGLEGVGAAMQAAGQPPMIGEDGSLQAMAGLQQGAAAPLAFFPSVAQIEAGQSVTWTVPQGFEPHTVSWPPIPPGSEIVPVPQEGGPPIITFGEAAFPSLESGSAVGLGDSFTTGIMFPGQSFTLTFTDPGVYQYVCILHAGMTGSVVVTPPA